MEIHMGTLTIRLTDDQHQRLKTLAARRGLSLNKLFEEFGTSALAEFDAETRFALRAARGRLSQGLRLLDQVDAHFDRRQRKRRVGR
jgi:plasmid stability protein